MKLAHVCAAAAGAVAALLVIGALKAVFGW